MNLTDRRAYQVKAHRAAAALGDRDALTVARRYRDAYEKVMGSGQEAAITV